MTEDSCPRVSSSESDSSLTKQRKRRKWDQPDESLISAGVALPGIFPLTNMESLASITLPVVQVAHVPLKQHAAALVQNLVQSRIQDELIAREIVINDADPAIRYKLTKRQTQEEIQKCTGAVVITRGKYRSPNAPSDGERPLYLHISAAAHLETTAERINAVDHAAAMVEEMLKQRSVSNGVKGDQSLNSCVFLGFKADPSLNIAFRIRGPNDQYVNHIMNETGVTVLLRGRGSGNSQNEQTEETQQPLHLFLSSNDPKSLEHAKLLAENLMDTIGAECGVSRVLPCKLYGAVPPPSQLQPGLLSPGNASEANDIAASSSTPLAGVSNVVSQGTLYQSVGVSNPGLPSACYSHVPLAGGTSYNGYGGIYPQATPLQQVALALKQSTSPATATVAPTTTAVVTELPTAPSMNNKRPQKRKFQELPAAVNGPVKPNQVISLIFYEANKPILDLYVSQKNLQGSEFPMPRELTSHVGARDISVLQSPRKSVLQPFKVMPPPPPRSISPQSPPPKFNSTPTLHGDNTVLHKSKPEAVPDTLIKLLDYGDDDDDDVADGSDLKETTQKKPFENHSSTATLPKPFWAV